jgi:hypothetical protein
MDQAKNHSAEGTGKLLAESATWLALVLSLLFAAMMIGPAIHHPNGHIVGNWNHPDCLGNHWLMVWVAERVLSLESLLHNPLYYAPFGDAPWLAGNGSEGFLYAPFHALFGWPKGANLYLFSVCTFNGLAAYALGRALGAGRFGAFLLLAAIGCSPYVAQELSSGRFSQANLGFFLSSLALFFHLLQKPSRKGAVALAICGAATCLLYFYYAFFLVLIGILVLLARRLRGVGIPTSFWLACGLGLVLVLPLFWVFYFNWAQIPGTAEGVFPHPEARIHASGLSPINLIRGEARLVAMSQSLLVLLFAALGLARRDTRSQGIRNSTLLLIALLGWWLCLGPNGGLYTAIYGLHPTLERFWWPYRHALILSVFLAALAARGLPSAWEKRRWPPLLIALCIPLSLHFQGLIPRAKSSPIQLPPSLYVQLSTLEGESLLQTPLNPRITAVQTPLIYQLFHKKKMLNGHAPWVDRVRPPKWDALLKDNSFLAALVAYEEAQISGEISFKAEDLQTLRDQGLRHLVVDQEFYVLKLRPLVDGTKAAFAELFGPPILRGKRAWVYDTDNWSGESHLVLAEWTWPKRLRPSHDGQALSGRRPPSALFSSQGPKGR